MLTNDERAHVIALHDADWGIRDVALMVLLSRIVRQPVHELADPYTRLINEVAELYSVYDDADEESEDTEDDPNSGGAS